MPYPMAELRRKDWHAIPFGRALPEPGQDLGPEIAIDLVAQAFSLVAGTPGSGKAQPLDTRIPVPVSDRFKDGWALLGDLAVGEEVFAADGTVTSITDLSPIIEGDIYEVSFSDGQTVQADSEHLWKVSSRNRRSNHHAGRPKQVRALADIEQQKSRLDSIRGRAVEASQRREQGPLTTIAELLGIDYTTAWRFASDARLPYVEVPVMGQPIRWGTECVVRKVRHYQVDEFLVSYAAALESRIDEQGACVSLFEIVTTAEMVQSLTTEGGARLNYAVPVAGALDLPQADLPVSPYLLGYWLGDGTSRAGNVTIGKRDLDAALDILRVEWPQLEVRPQAGRATRVTFPRPDAHPCPSGHDDWAHEHGARQCRSCLRGGRKVAGRTKPLAGLLRESGLLGVGNKHIPAEYLRASREQRLALLQGLMDTDGTVSKSGTCEFSVVSRRLAYDTLELVRSLGIKATITENDATITEVDPTLPGATRRRSCGTSYRVKFTTTEPVFRLPRKAARIKAAIRETQNLNYVTGIRKVASVPARCIRVAHPEHMYLTEGFVPTHNTVTLNSLIASQVANGAELVIVDLPSKSIDFLWCKPFCRPGGWGCDSLAASVTALALVYEEGQRRAKILADEGVVNWLDLPKAKTFKPIFIVVDEVTGLLTTEKAPTGIPKDHPLVIEAVQHNLLVATLQKYINRIIAELRFVGVRMVLSTQVTNNTTGIGPSLKAKIGHKILQGPNPSEVARKQAFNDPAAVPTVPDNVRADGKVAKGVGAAELEGAAPAVYKSYFGRPEDFAAALDALGVRRNPCPEPTPDQIAKHTPSIEDAGEYDSGSGRGGRDEGYGFQAGPVIGDDGQTLKGAAAANHAHKVQMAQMEQQRKRAAAAAPAATATATADDDW